MCLIRPVLPQIKSNQMFPHFRSQFPADTNGRPLPPPCPPECVDTLPVDMWEAYWTHSEKGRLPLPASVPYRLSRFDKRWADATRKWKSDHGSVPKVWKAYWGKFMTDSKPFDMEGNALPDEFWIEYLRNHPDGHWEDDTPGDGTAPPWTAGRGFGDGIRDSRLGDDRLGDRAEDKTGYYLIKGRLCFKHKNGMTYSATGVDSFPPM